MTKHASKCDIPSQLTPSVLRVYPSSQAHVKEYAESMQMCSQPPLSISHSFSACIVVKLGTCSISFYS